MALEIEDGTGKANAQSYVELTYAVTFLAARGIAFEGTDTQKEQALVSAFDYLTNEQRFRYRGRRSTSTQRASFPRTDCQERNGPLYGPTDIPWRLKDAQCLLAALARSGPLEVSLRRGGQIMSETIGPISRSYAAGASPETTYTGVVGLLWPLVSEASWEEASFYFDAPDIEPEFSADTYRNSGIGIIGS